MMDGLENSEREEIFSKAVRAGKRTYFFDVKSTKGNDFYLTVTESKKRFNDDGTFRYEKHKLFLYKEDFEKFMEGLNEAVEKIKNLKEDHPDTHQDAEFSHGEKKFSNIDFEDLER
jgi:hypothetical protein